MPAHTQLDMQADTDPRAPSMLACPDCTHKQGQVLNLFPSVFRRAGRGGRRMGGLLGGSRAGPHCGRARDCSHGRSAGPPQCKRWAGAQR